MKGFYWSMYILQVSFYQNFTARVRHEHIERWVWVVSFAQKNDFLYFTMSTIELHNIHFEICADG